MKRGNQKTTSNEELAKLLAEAQEQVATCKRRLKIAVRHKNKLWQCIRARRVRHLANKYLALNP